MGTNTGAAWQSFEDCTSPTSPTVRPSPPFAHCVTPVHPTRLTHETPATHLLLSSARQRRNASGHRRRVAAHLARGSVRPRVGISRRPLSRSSDLVGRLEQLAVEQPNSPISPMPMLNERGLQSPREELQPVRGLNPQYVAPRNIHELVREWSAMEAKGDSVAYIGPFERGARAAVELMLLEEDENRSPHDQRADGRQAADYFFVIMEVTRELVLKRYRKSDMEMVRWELQWLYDALHHFYVHGSPTIHDTYYGVDFDGRYVMFYHRARHQIPRPTA